MAEFIKMCCTQSFCYLDIFLISLQNVNYLLIFFHLVILLRIGHKHGKQYVS